MNFIHSDRLENKRLNAAVPQHLARKQGFNHGLFAETDPLNENGLPR
jgi:hypothetical protein